MENERTPLIVHNPAEEGVREEQTQIEGPKQRAFTELVFLVGFCLSMSSTRYPLLIAVALDLATGYW
jgi:hypothetical protein